MTRNQCFVLLSATLTIFGFGPWGCIDVGHPSEIGCLVDMEEPGCNRPEGTGGKPSVKSSGGGSSAGGNAGIHPANTGGAGDADDAGDADTDP